VSGNYYRVFDNESFVKDSFSAWCDIYCFDCQGFVFGVAIGVLPEIKLKKMTVVKRFNHPFAAFDDFFQSGVDKFFISDQKAKTPSVNVKESDAGFDIHVVAPGYKKEDFALKVEKDTLSISVKLESSNEAKEDGKWIRNEYKLYSFNRSFTLPENVDVEAIEAKYEDGILKLSLPKMELVEGNGVRQITIS